MKTVKQWEREKKVFKLSEQELIEQVQLDAYNSAVRDVWKNVKLCANDVTKGKNIQTYTPTHGILNISIDETSVLGLIKDA